MTARRRRAVIAIALSAVVIGSCSDEDDSTNGSTTTSGPGGDVTLVDDFENGSDGWASDMSDFSEATRPDDFLSETGSAPPGFDAADGFVHLAATNTSDDVFMFLRRQVGPDDGLEPSTDYEIGYTVEFASDAPTGCAGIGGAPGESVWLKVGATAEEPLPVNSDGDVRLSVDKGNQSQAGPAAVIAGDVANGIPCEEALDSDRPPFAMVEHSAAIEATTDDEGNLWLFVGTDSGFEGRTSIHYDRIEVNLSPQA
ncbi:MAG: hypothetical protein R8G01_21360 [Ilumatobacteraceae bacterium]|nr:hypothetical protein [Ilumatobacteraceae bacterium]